MPCGTVLRHFIEHPLQYPEENERGSDRTAFSGIRPPPTEGPHSNHKLEKRQAEPL